MVVCNSLAEPKQAVCMIDTGHSQEFALTERTPVDVSICVMRKSAKLGESDSNAST